MRLLYQTYFVGYEIPDEYLEFRYITENYTINIHINRIYDLHIAGYHLTEK